MLFRTTGRRFEVDTDAGLFLRCPLLGEVFTRSERYGADAPTADYWRETDGSRELRLGKLAVTWSPLRRRKMQAV